ncbi:MAG: pyridoxamine 5'-phosphate oxidase family protein [Desulfobacterales bacterium]|nr:pyridoxamine 5'-phosphate oxidase family protein [Desulfobacterales bacterium]
MNSSEEIKNIIRNLLNSQKFATLTSADKEKPYANLVAFVSTDDLEQILFATSRNTRKYSILTKNPNVAFLIDNRSNQDSDIYQAIAVTAIGKAETVEGPQRNNFVECYIAKHPYLEEFVTSPSCALISVKVEYYYLVKKFEKVLELHIRP